jgi:hypothetical protein
MDQAMSAPGARQFRIGNVLRTSFAVLGRNIVPFALIAIVISIPSIVVTRVFPVDPNSYPVDSNGQHLLFYYSLGSKETWIRMFANLITSSLISAALVYGTFQDLRGQRAAIGELVARGFSSLLPVLLAAIAFTLLTIVGTLLLVVPGVIVILALWVYVPVIVVERKSVGEAFRRSRELTKGRRWSILSLFIIVFAVIITAEVILSSALHIPFAALAAHWVAIPIQILYMVFIAVMSTVGYYFLRADKEGVAIGDIAKVFD